MLNPSSLWVLLVGLAPTSLTRSPLRDHLPNCVAVFNDISRPALLEKESTLNDFHSEGFEVIGGNGYHSERPSRGSGCITMPLGSRPPYRRGHRGRPEALYRHDNISRNAPNTHQILARRISQSTVSLNGPSSTILALITRTTELKSMGKEGLQSLPSIPDIVAYLAEKL